MNEADLLSAYRSTVAHLATECACGGLIEANDHPATIRQAVEEHNASLIHSAWREEREAMTNSTTSEAA